MGPNIMLSWSGNSGILGRSIPNNDQKLVTLQSKKYERNTLIVPKDSCLESSVLMATHHIHKKHTFTVPKHSCHYAPYPRSTKTAVIILLGGGTALNFFSRGEYGCYHITDTFLVPDVTSLTHIPYSVTMHGTDGSPRLA